MCLAALSRVWVSCAATICAILSMSSVVNPWVRAVSMARTRGVRCLLPGV